MLVSWLLNWTQPAPGYLVWILAEKVAADAYVLIISWESIQPKQLFEPALKLADAPHWVVVAIFPDAALQLIAADDWAVGIQLSLANKGAVHDA